MLSLLYSFLISFFTGLMLQISLRVTLAAALFGGLSYGMYLLVGDSVTGYFAAALVLALLSEVGARVLKTPASSFLIVGIYPLVPGSNIYRTMRFFMEGNVASALTMGGKALASMMAIAIAVAIGTAAFQKISQLSAR